MSTDTPVIKDFYRVGDRSGDSFEYSLSTFLNHFNFGCDDPKAIIESLLIHGTYDWSTDATQVFTCLDRKALRQQIFALRNDPTVPMADRLDWDQLLNRVAVYDANRPSPRFSGALGAFEVKILWEILCPGIVGVAPVRHGSPWPSPIKARVPTVPRHGPRPLQCKEGSILL